MRVGLIARSEDRGLGILTWAFHRNLVPDRTLLVSMGKLGGGWDEHHDRYPDATVAPFDGVQLPEDVVRPWLDGLDVVYSAETFYDDRLVGWARAAGVATVLHVMPEFHRAHLDPPDVTWTPTSWRLDLLPERTVVVPVPVEADVFDPAVAADGGPLVVVHVAGKRAMGDRNGTLQVAQAVRMVRQPMQVRVVTQEPRLPAMRTRTRGVTVETVLGGTATRAELYAGAHVLLMPRRFGGLCLPAQEAMAAGLGLAMSDCPPNTTDWPALPLPGVWSGAAATPGGNLRLFTANPARMAAALDRLATHPDETAALQAAAVSWARDHTWNALAPLYRAQLADAAKSCQAEI